MVNQETKSAEDTDRIESKSGIALARMNARIQKTVPILIQIIHVRLVFLSYSMFDLHDAEYLREDVFDGGMGENK